MEYGMIPIGYIWPFIEITVDITFSATLIIAGVLLRVHDYTMFFLFWIFPDLRARTWLWPNENTTQITLSSSSFHFKRKEIVNNDRKIVIL